ncbi:M50 family metallopeptidase [Sanguibacter sp. A247]|uniref:M50 family metallopeptidase n=1 Tax=unclassified Sanguibacter TaxID=2645534 RepID=UPI003FD7F2F2
MTDVLYDIWAAATTASPPPATALVLAGTVVALLLVAWRPAWGVVRHGVTAVHEACHLLVAALTGRTIMGIRLHTDTSGLALSKGRASGPGMVLMTAAGYTGPAVVGLAAAFGVGRGYDVGVLWALVVLALFVLLMIRNWYGLWTILVTLALLGALTWWGTPEVHAFAAHATALVLLVGSVRAVVELGLSRRAGRGRSSDADALGRLTRLPGGFWVGVFGLVTSGALALGTWWLVGPTLSGVADAAAALVPR